MSVVGAILLLVTQSLTTKGLKGPECGWDLAALGEVAVRSATRIRRRFSDKRGWQQVASLAGPSCGGESLHGANNS